jgi:hypothetical protein
MVSHFVGYRDLAVDPPGFTAYDHAPILRDFPRIRHSLHLGAHAVGGGDIF